MDHPKDKLVDVSNCIPEIIWKSSSVLKKQDNFSLLKDYRDSIYTKLGSRKDAAMDLIDALASQTRAKSVTDLSNEAPFIRKYSSVNDAISYTSQNLSPIKKHIFDWGIDLLPEIVLGELNSETSILAVDVTTAAHPHSKCLKDRTNIYDSTNKITGRPVNIGHNYSVVVGITPDPEWVVPISLSRVPSDKISTQFGIGQLIDAANKRGNKHTIGLLDSSYNNIGCRSLILEDNKKGGSENLSIIVRSQCNRNYFTIPEIKEGKRGRPPTYGKLINLKDPINGPLPDFQYKIKDDNNTGLIEIFVWNKVITKHRGCKDNNDPSMLIIIIEYNSLGLKKYTRPLVLRLFTSKHDSFNKLDSAWLYFFRFRIEPYFSVLKKRLMFDKFYSPETDHQETFAVFGEIAYQQWFLAKESEKINWIMNPWMKYPKKNPKGLRQTPSNFQRGFLNVLKEVGTPSKYRAPSYVGQGRQEGAIIAKRPLQPVIKKEKNSANVKVSLEKDNIPSPPSMSNQVKGEALQTVAACYNKDRIKNLAVLFIVLIFNTYTYFPTQGSKLFDIALEKCIFTINNDEVIEPRKGIILTKTISMPYEYRPYISNGRENTYNWKLVEHLLQERSQGPPEKRA